MAQRLNKKKIESRALREENTKLKIQLAQYKRYIFELRKQKDELKKELLTVNDAVTTRCNRSISLMSNAVEELHNLGNVRENIAQVINNSWGENVENVSYLANTSLLNALQQPAHNTRPKRPFAGKSRKKGMHAL